MIVNAIGRNVSPALSGESPSTCWRYSELMNHIGKSAALKTITTTVCMDCHKEQPGPEKAAKNGRDVGRIGASIFGPAGNGDRIQQADLEGDRIAGKDGADAARPPLLPATDDAPTGESEICVDSAYIPPVARCVDSAHISHAPMTVIVTTANGQVVDVATGEILDAARPTCGRSWTGWPASSVKDQSWRF